MFIIIRPLRDSIKPLDVTAVVIWRYIYIKLKSNE